MSELYYCVYGLYVAVDVPIPNLPPLTDVPRIDLHIWLAKEHPAPVEYPGADSSLWKPHPGLIDRRFPGSENEGLRLEVLLSDDEQYLCFCYSDDTKFLFTQDGQQIWVQWDDDLAFAYVLAYLLNPAMGFIHRLRRQVCLHASAAVIDGKALVLCGTSGAGKSTTAAYFATRGHTIITDDIGVLVEEAGQIGVQPGYPLLRLPNRTTEALFGSIEALPAVVADWSKRYLDLQGPNFGFATQVTPIGVVYIINEWGDQASIRELSPGQALYELLKSTYMSYLLDSTLRSVDFAMLSRLVQSVPVRMLTAPKGLIYLPDLYNTLLADYADQTALSLRV